MSAHMEWGVPPLPNSYMRRSRLEGALEALVQRSLGFGSNLCLCNKGNSREKSHAPGKSALLAKCLHRLINSGDLRQALWLSLDQYRNGDSCIPYHLILLSLANKIRELHSKDVEFVNLSHLHASTVEECQEYIRIMASSIPRINEVVLVLDGAIEAKEVSMFAYLGIKVIVTTRILKICVHVLDKTMHGNEEEIGGVMEIDGFSVKQAILHAQNISGLSNAVPRATVEKLESYTNCIRCITILSSVIKSNGELDMIDIQSHTTIDIQNCMDVVLENMSPLERRYYLMLALAPPSGLINIELAAKIWKVGTDESVHNLIQTFLKNGLLQLTQFENMYQLHYDFHRHISGYVLTKNKKSVKFIQEFPLHSRIEIVTAMLAYVTDISIFQRTDFVESHLNSFVSCWDHLLKLDSLVYFEGLCDKASPMKSYDDIFQNQEKYSETVILNILRVVLSIDKDSYAGEKYPFSWNCVKNWSLEKTYKVVENFEKAIASPETNENATTYYLELAKSLVNIDHVKAIACIELFLQAYCAIERSGAEVEFLLQLSDGFYFLAKCHEKSDELHKSEVAIDSAIECLQDAFADTSTQDFTLHPDFFSMTLWKVNMFNRMDKCTESKVILSQGIQLCEDDESKDSIGHHQSREALAQYCTYLGNTFLIQKKWKNSRKAYEEATSIFLEMYGDNHPRSIRSMEDLALCCSLGKLHENALLIYQRSFSSRQICFGLQYPSNKNIIEKVYEIMSLVKGVNDAKTLYLKPILKKLMNLEMIGKKSDFLITGDHKDALIKVLHLYSELSQGENNDRNTKGYAKKAVEIAIANAGVNEVFFYQNGKKRHEQRRIGEAHAFLGNFYDLKQRFGKASESYMTAFLYYAYSEEKDRKQLIHIIDLCVKCFSSADLHADAQYVLQLKNMVYTQEKSNEVGFEHLSSLGKLSFFTRKSLNELLDIYTQQNKEQENSKLYQLLQYEYKLVVRQDNGQEEEKNGSDSMDKKVEEKNDSEISDSKSVKINTYNDEEYHIESIVLENQLATQLQSMYRMHRVRSKFVIELNEFKQKRTISNRNKVFLQACIMGDDTSVKAILSDKGNIQLHDVVDGSSLLTIACIAEHLNVVKVLLYHGLSISESDCDGNTPFLVTCCNGRLDIYQELITSEGFNQAVIKAKDVDGQSALLIACKEGHIEIVSDLLDRDVDVNENDDAGNTPLISAVMEENKEIISLLVQCKGIDIDKSNNFGDTALLIATLKGYLEICKILLYAGADKKTQNIDGMTPVEVAVWNNDESMFQLLLEEDGKATLLQSVWRMYKVRKSEFGRDVDRRIKIANAKWSDRHIRGVVVFQSLCRMHAEKKNYKLLLYNSVVERVKDYALLKIAPRLLFYVKQFLSRSPSRNRNAMIIQRWWASVFTPSQNSLSAKKWDYKNNRPATKASTSPERKEKNRKLRNAFATASGAIFTKVTKRTLPTKFEDNLITMLEKGLSWDYIEIAIRSKRDQVETLYASGEYPLQIALRMKSNSKTVIGLLKEYPSAAESGNHVGNTAMHIFLANISGFKSDCLELFNSIYSAYPDSVRVRNTFGDLPIHMLSNSLNEIDSNDALQMAEILLSAYPISITKQNNSGYLPLHICLKQKSVGSDIVSKYIEMESSTLLQKCDGEQRHPIQIALQSKCDVSVIQLLMKEGAGEIPSEDQGLGSALHLSLKYKCTDDVVMAILSYDTSAVKIADMNGHYPLHLALKSYNNPSLDVVEKIIEHNEEAAGLKVYGSYPLQYALLKNFSADIISALNDAHPYNDSFVEQAQKIIQSKETEKGSDNNKEDPNSHAMNNVRVDFAAIVKIQTQTINLTKEQREKARLERENKATILNNEREQRGLENARLRTAREKEATKRREEAAAKRISELEKSRASRTKARQEQLSALEEAIAKDMSSYEGRLTKPFVSKANDASPTQPTQSSMSDEKRFTPGKDVLNKWRKTKLPGDDAPGGCLAKFKDSVLNTPSGTPAKHGSNPAVMSAMSTSDNVVTPGGAKTPLSTIAMRSSNSVGDNTGMSVLSPLSVHRAMSMKLLQSSSDDSDND